MPKSTNPNPTSVGKVTTAKPSGISIPTDIVQLVSEVPKGPRSCVSKPEYKLTTGSKRKEIISRVSVGSYWANLPIKEGLVYVPQIAKVIETIAQNYQRTHQDAWFAQHPDLIITYDSEGDWQDWSMDELRLKYRELSLRVANRLLQYDYATTMLVGSFANLIELSSFDGKGNEKDIAAEYKWSTVNKRCTNVMHQYPLPVGLQDYVYSNTNIAVGWSNHDAPFVAYCFWRSVIWGNVGEHCIPLTNLTANNSDTTQDVAVVDDDMAITDANASALKLVQNCYKVAQQYGYDIADISGSGNSRKYTNQKNAPHMWEPLNGTTILTDADDERAAVTLNQDGLSWENRLSTFWDNWKFWRDYLARWFSDFTDKNSDWYKVFTDPEIFKLFEEPMGTKQVLNIIHDRDRVVSAVDLIQHMTTRKRNQPNTATIVKFAPLIVSQIGSKDTVNTPENFSRYDSINKNVPAMIYESQQWPRLTPTVLYDAIGDQADSEQFATEPIVMNTISGIGSLVGDNSTTENGVNVREPLGSAGTLFDMVCCNNTDPLSSFIETIGVDSNDALDYMKLNDMLIPQEAPVSGIVKVQPMFDPSDPLQAGFNIIIQADAAFRSEWETFLTNPENFYVPTVPTVGSQFILPYTNKQPTVPVLEIDPRVVGDVYLYNMIHTANELFMNKAKYVQVFLGMGLFTSPLEALTDPRACHGEMIFWGDTAHMAKGSNVKKLATSFNETSFEPSTIGAYVGEMHRRAMAQNYIPSDIKEWSKFDVSKLSYRFTPAAAASDYISLLYSATGGSPSRYITFSPFYPPIDFARPEVPDVVSYSNSIVNSVEDSDTKWGTQQTPNPVAGISMWGSGDSGGMANVDIKTMDRQFVVINRAKVLWFLNQVSCLVGYLGKDGDYSPILYQNADKPMVPVVFSDRRSQAAALLSRARIMFAGQEDTMPFWDIPTQLKVETGKVAPTMAAIPRIELLVSDRKDINVTKGQSYSRFVRQHKGQLDSERAKAIEASSSNRGERKNTTSKDSKPWWKDKRNKNQSSKGACNTDKPDSKLGVDATNSTLDPATPQDKKDAKKAALTPTDPLSIQV